MPVHPVRRPAVIAAALAVLRDGDWSRLEGCPEAETTLREYHGGGVVWFVASGTAALEAIMLGHEIGPGDEVITTPYTWAATVSSILAIGAVPVFCDVDPISGLIDPRTVEACITARTRALLAVHLFGHPVDCDALAEITRRRGILFFEDGSQAHGARWRGKRVGRMGHASAFSCMGLKLLAGTEGGYCLFGDERAAEVAALYGRHPRGLEPSAADRLTREGLLDALQLGWRPGAVSGALVQAALPHLDEENALRQKNARRLRENLRGVAFITMPPELPGAEGCYHLLSLLYDEQAAGVPRDQFLQRLKQAGLGGFRYLPRPIHRLRRMQAFDYAGPRVFWHEQLRRAGMDYRNTRCPGAEWRCERSIEFAFNWTQDNPRAMDQIAEILAWAGAA